MFLDLVGDTRLHHRKGGPIARASTLDAGTYPSSQVLSNNGTIKAKG